MLESLSPQRWEKAVQPRSNLLESSDAVVGFYGEKLMRASSYLKRLYNIYNKKYFRNKLPAQTKLYFVFKIGKSKSPTKSNCAITYFYEDSSPIVVVQRTKAKSMRYVSADLLHEMAHIAHPRAEHGKVFQQEMKRLAKENAFHNIW